jgi:hypothetical protein
MRKRQLRDRRAVGLRTRKGRPRFRAPVADGGARLEAGRGPRAGGAPARVGRPNMTRATTFFAAALLAIVSPPALAEDGGAGKPSPEPEAEVLIPRSARHGGWGAPVVQVSTVRDRAAVLAGGRGGWLLDGRLTLGGGGMGLATEIPAPAAAQVPGERRLDLEMGYGGGWIEYTFSPLRLVHVSVGALVGGGGVSLKFRHGGSYGSGSDAFFVAEPTVAAELNLARFVRLDLGLAYRWIVGANMPGLSYSDVAGVSGVLALKFGKF